MISMQPESVVYASSFSKTVCPGIRVGYLVGSKDLIAGIVKIDRTSVPVKRRSNNGPRILSPP